MTEAPWTIEREFEAFVVGNYIAWSLFALAVYEYVVTFDQEVVCVWRRKFSATSLLLLSTRWVMVLYQATGILPRSHTSCTQWNAIAQLVYFVSVAQIALFSGLRVYALWHDSKYRYFLLGSVVVLGCVPIGTNIFGWARLQISWQGAPFYTCVYVTNVSDTLNTIAHRHKRMRYRC
ncbi:hypothetical protein PsYK624_145810 [Phanerochaete sordida]|uniref:DUF6533 domain-containing protein n=1 Tax=Phanerochaete sordida TaxID=48140 RepID=A0A9P3LKA9_9APHY|nr:hypothetical protein PsYK624_145810 [Phanerochaete sordida]